MDAKAYIDKLALLPHPEGGFYRETYRSISTQHYEGFVGERNVCTAIYFLLNGKDKSHFHRIKSDEIWYFHDGATLELFILDENGLTTIHIGKNLANGEVLQAVVPANTWFASKVKNDEGFVLVSCSVAPGFSFEDFEMATVDALTQEFPHQIEIITLMTLV